MPSTSVARTSRDLTSSSTALDIGVYLSSLGLTRGGLETRAMRMAEILVERGYSVTLVAGRVQGQALSQDLAVLPVRWLRVPCIPTHFGGWRRISRRRPGWPLLIQSLSFAYACRLSAPAWALI